MESDQCDEDDSVNRSLFSEMDATDPQQITDSPSSTAAVVAGCEPSEARTEGDTSDAISGPPPHDASVPQGAAAGNENVVDQRLRRRKIAPAASALESAAGPSKGSGGLIDLTDSPDAYKPAAKRHSGNDNTRIIIPDTPENGKASSFAQPPEQDTSKVVRLGDHEDSPASNVAVVGKSIEISSDDEDIFSPQKQARAQDKESSGGGCAPRNIVSHPPPPPPPPAPAAIVKRATPSDEEDSDSICDMTHGAPDNGSSFSKREGKQVASDRNDGVDKTQFARELFKEWYPLLEEAPLLRTHQLQHKLSQYAFQQGVWSRACVGVCIGVGALFALFCFCLVNRDARAVLVSLTTQFAQENSKSIAESTKKTRRALGTCVCHVLAAARSTRTKEAFKSTWYPRMARRDGLSACPSKDKVLLLWACDVRCMCVYCGLVWCHLLLAHVLNVIEPQVHTYSTPMDRATELSVDDGTLIAKKLQMSLRK